MYGYPGSIAIRHLLDEPMGPTHAQRTSTDRHASRWLVAVLVAPVVLAVVMAALLVSAAPSQAASAQASSVQSRYLCHPTWRWSGCIPPQLKRQSSTASAPTCTAARTRCGPTSWPSAPDERGRRSWDLTATSSRPA